MADIPVWKYGKGETTLVLVHGGPSLSRYMQTLGNLLQEKFSIVEYQQRGTPEFPADQVSLKDLIHDLKSVLDACPKNRILIGHSWGATLINLYLQNNNEKAIFLDPAPLTDDAAKKFSENLNAKMPVMLQEQLEALKAEAKELEDPSHLMQIRLDLISPYYHKDPATDKKLGYLGWEYKSFCTLIDEAWELIDAGKLGPRPEIPVLHGNHDPIPHLPHAHLIENAGHFPWLENKEKFLHALEKLILTV